MRNPLLLATAAFGLLPAAPSKAVRAVNGQFRQALTTADYAVINFSGFALLTVFFGNTTGCFNAGVLRSSAGVGTFTKFWLSREEC